MARRKAKKAKTVIDPDTQNKIDKLKKLLSDFKTQTAEYESYLNEACVERCKNIEKLYQDQLKSIPEHIRNMTLSQYLELQEKENARKTECPRDENAIRMQFERQKMTSEKKRTQRREKKRSISAPSSARGLSNARHPLCGNLSRTTSEMSLLTPVNKNKKLSKAVTPKFNPEVGVSMARKPKPREILMSLSGSPVHNYIDEWPADKPAAKITLSLGQGKIITLNGDAELETESEFFKTMDEPLKATILGVQKQLSEILKK